MPAARSGESGGTGARPNLSVGWTLFRSVGAKDGSISRTAGQKRAYSPAATHNTGIGKSPAQNRPQSAINVLHLHPGTPSRAQKRPLKAICVQHYFRQGRPPPCSGTGLRPSEKLVRSPAPAPKDGPHKLDPEHAPKREERTPGAQTRPSPGTGPSEQSDGPLERSDGPRCKNTEKALHL